DEARLFLGGQVLLLHVLEAAGVPEGALRLVVPADARGPVRLVGVDEKERGQDRVEVRLVLHRDPVLGLDAHDFRDRHVVPLGLTVSRADEDPPAVVSAGGADGGDASSPPSRYRSYRYWPV